MKKYIVEAEIGGQFKGTRQYEVFGVDEKDARNTFENRDFDDFTDDLWDIELHDEDREHATFKEQPQENEE